MDDMDVKNQLPQLDEMRKARQTSNVAFISFTDNYPKFSSHVFCFYEGEDGKYYNQRIKNILGDNIISIKIGNKKEVLKAWCKIKFDPTYDSTRKMFFVDRDMDEIPKDKNDDLYITPCYSIENLYVNKKTFGDILQSEFSCSKIDADYQKCMNKFEELYIQFNELMVEFNALVLLRKKKDLGNGKVRLSNIKTQQLISININGITKGSKYVEIISDLKKKLKVKEDELSKAINDIKTKGDYDNLFRGKNQLDFMVTLITIFRELHKENNFFDKKEQSVTINITGNRLSELSQYADFPRCLQNFIEKHKIMNECYH